MFPSIRSLDDVPIPIWFALAILGFVVWWPLGLLILGFMMWSGKMSCCGFGFGRWNERTDRSSTPVEWPRQQATSGNRAFDEYRAETLKRLEDEQRGFREFVDRLRHAKDKAEFDQFMAQHKQRPTPPNDQPQG